MSSEPAVVELIAGSVPVVSVDMRLHLDAGESLTGTPTVTEIGGSTLAFDNEAVSTGTLTIRGRDVPAGQAITFRIASGITGGIDHQVRVSCDTDSTPAQTRKEDVVIRGVA